MTHVDPDIAVEAMTESWREFGNEVSSPLLDTWRSMCVALNDTAQSASSVGWTALAMPTGIGKTQFAALYCALMPNPAPDLHNLQSAALHPGILFVTRFVTEANKFVELVNRRTGCKTAVAYYRQSPTTLTEAADFPVLAITHAACERHQLSSVISASGNTVWEQLISWQHGRRAKIIIDETPNFITPVQIKTTSLTQTLGALRWLRDANRELYVSIERLLATITDASLGSQNRALTSGEFQCIRSIDVGLIRKHLESVDDDAITLDCGAEKRTLRTTCKQTLISIEGLQRNGWGWVSFMGRTAQLNSATLHQSLRSGSGVILDGTAALYAGYGLLSPPAKVIKASANVRRYDTVTLHLARGHNVGKEYLVERAERLWPQYRSAIMSVLPDRDRILVCCHKDFEQRVHHDPANPARMTFEHCGNLDGRNDWDEHEAVALIGLYYLDGATPANIAQALLGPQTDHWLQNSPARRIGAHGDVLTSIQRAHMAASAVQAINRVHCRKPVDAAGRCKPTNVFLALPSNADGDAALAAILEAMPGIQVKTWQLNVGKRKPRAVPTSKKLLGFFEKVPVGGYTKAQVKMQAPITAISLDRAIKRISDPSSSEHRRLAKLGVTYFIGSGRGAPSYFVKAQM
jgi:hypothetical protein